MAQPKTKELTRIPAVMTGHALRSLRDSGYSLAAALGEPIDNSIEAGAHTISILLLDNVGRFAKKRVHQIAMIDDGCGMDEVTLQRYPVIGYSTRYMSTKTIGKYGVGAKLAALNFCKRIDVWSRMSADEPWKYVFLDLAELENQEANNEDVGIDPPTERPIPSEISKYMPIGGGTLVLWSQVDRLEEGRLAEDANTLRLELESELSRIFRYFLNGGIRIALNDKPLVAHDPLFLMSDSWAEKIMEEHGIPPEKARIIANEPITLDGSTAYLKVTVYPKGVVRERGKGGDKVAKKLHIPENEGALSFVRLNREISYTNVPKILPFGVTEKDRFIGIEVSFSPELDDYFGVRNVKRGAEPHDKLRREIRKQLDNFIREARKDIDEMWGEAQKRTRAKEGEHGAAESAAREVDKVMPRSRAKGPESEDEKQRILDDLARDVGIENEKDKAEYLERKRGLPFVIESVDFPGTNFIDIRHLDGQVIIRLNTRHRFYREMWEPLKDVAEAAPEVVSLEAATSAARRTIEALTLLLISYGKAESMHEHPQEQYGDLRTFWGQFLDTMMGKIKNVI